MKQLLKLIACAACLSLVFSLASCMDLGAGDAEEALGDYISEVYVLTEQGVCQYSISHFTAGMGLGDTNIPVVVPYDEYCYIGFRIADGYTVTLSEFAFFAKTYSGNGVLDLEFYIVDKMPTVIKGSDGSDVALSSPVGGGSNETEPDARPDAETDTGTESLTRSETEDHIREEDLFLSDNQFHSSRFTIGEAWDSVLLQFGGEKTVKGGQFVIVRIKNNCYSASDDKESDPVAFTFNYLLFYINSAHK